MNKHLILAIFTFLLILGEPTFAQKITIGAKGGFSIPNLTGGSTDNPLNTGYSSRLANDGGVYGEYHVNKKFAVSVGLEYSSQGGLKNGLQAFPNPITIPTYLYANFKNEAKLNYLLVPLLAKYSWRLNKKSPVRIYAALGPFAGMLLNAKQITIGTSATFLNSDGTVQIFAPQSFDGSTSIKSQLYTFNAGVEGFVGISYSFTKSHALFIEGGGNYGFLSIQKGTANGKNYTGAGVLNFGYAFTLPNKYGQRGRR
jgi:Outer membrane protein beta-barrel domain